MPRREFHRSDRVAAELRREVALLVHHDVRAGALPEVSVSDVEVTRDLSLATVFVTALHPEEREVALKLLGEQARAYRQHLSKALTMRQVPALRFRYDDSVDRGERIDHLLRTLK